MNRQSTITRLSVLFIALTVSVQGLLAGTVSALSGTTSTSQSIPTDIADFKPIPSDQRTSPNVIAIASDGTRYIGGSRSIMVYDNTNTFVRTLGVPGWSDGSFAGVNDIDIASDGTLYITDSLANKVIHMSNTGTYLGGFGSYGTGNGQFNFPAESAIASDGSIYVTDMMNQRVQHFSSAGVYLGKFGSGGDGIGQLAYPSGIDIAADGTIYVSGQAKPMIQHFDALGNYLDTITLPVANASIMTGTLFSIEVASDNSLYIGSMPSNTIYHYAANGTLQGQFGTPGTGNGQFSSYCCNIALAADGSVYATDTFANRIEHFSAAGAYLDQFAIAVSPTPVYGTDAVAAAANGTVYTRASNTIYAHDLAGSLLNQFTVPASGSSVMAAAADGTLYVLEPYDTVGRVDYYSPAGVKLGEFGAPGTGDGNLSSGLWDITLAQDGTVYVVDSGNGRIQHFSATGAYLDQFAATNAAGIAVGPTGNIYVTNITDSRVDYYSPAGVKLGEFGAPGTGDGQFTDLKKVVVGSNGAVYAIDATTRLQVFSQNGTYVGQAAVYDNLGYRSFSSQAMGWGYYAGMSMSVGFPPHVSPSSIAWSPLGRIYVASATKPAIQQFILPDNLGTVTSETGKTINVSLPEGNDITAIQSVNGDGADDTYPLGLVQVTDTPRATGGSEQFQVFFETTLSPSDVVPMLYNPTTKKSVKIVGTTITRVTQGGKQGLLVAYTVTDGGAYDLDGVANRSISHVLGLSTSTTGEASLANTGMPLTLTAVVAGLSIIVSGALIVRRNSTRHHRYFVG